MPSHLWRSVAARRGRQQPRQGTTTATAQRQSEPDSKRARSKLKSVKTSRGGGKCKVDRMDELLQNSDAANSWEDDLQADASVRDGGHEQDSDGEEEEYVPPREDATMAMCDDDGNHAPVLLVSLSAVAAREISHSIPDVHKQLLITLKDGFVTTSADLFASRVCRHSERWRCEDEREKLEECEPGSVYAVIEYPESIDGVAVSTLWHGLRAPTEWEVVDELKTLVSEVSRDLRWKSEMCVELEAMAVREAEARRVREVDELYAQCEDWEQLHGCSLSHLTPFQPPQPASQDRELAAGAADTEDAVSSLDLVLDLLLRDLPRPPATSLADHMEAIAERRTSLRRMWRATFG
eukprot:2921989-Pleurochrysis_carterae.AAC.2